MPLGPLKPSQTTLRNRIMPDSMTAVLPDIVYILLLIVLFALMAGYAAACDKL